MRKLLIVVLTIGCMASISGSAFAVAPPASPFDIQCDFPSNPNPFGHNCGLNSETVKVRGEDQVVSPSYVYNFAANIYTFSIISGWWKQSSGIDIDHFGTIYMDLGGGNQITLGDGISYGSGSDVDAARTSNPGLFSTTFTHGGGDILFFTDNTPRGNSGTITVSYAVVPEPISSVLFLVGGTALAARSWYRRKRKAG